MSATGLGPTQLSPYVACRECGKDFPRRSVRCTVCGKPNRPPKPADGVLLNCYQCGAGMGRRSNVCPDCGFAH
jgi:hypothetical protein